MALRKLRYDDDSILRKHSKEIETVDGKTIQLLDDMLETLEEVDGFGLAAPQVGVLKRAVVILYSGEEDEDEEEFKGKGKHKRNKNKKKPDPPEEEVEPELYEFINPIIVEQHGTQKIAEACLSVPGKNGVVERPKTVTVRALNRAGQEFELTAEGLLARGICHEIDHLDGILYIDKATDIKENNQKGRRRKRKKLR